MEQERLEMDQERLEMDQWGLKMYFYQKNPVLLSKKVTDEGGIPPSTDKLFDKKGGTDWSVKKYLSIFLYT